MILDSGRSVLLSLSLLSLSVLSRHVLSTVQIDKTFVIISNPCLMMKHLYICIEYPYTYVIVFGAVSVLRRHVMWCYAQYSRKDARQAKGGLVLWCTFVFVFDLYLHLYLYLMQFPGRHVMWCERPQGGQKGGLVIQHLRLATPGPLQDIKVAK